MEEALKKWPPVGGLGGYLLNGGKYLDAFGTPEDDRHGLWNCLKGLREINDGQVLVVPELGKLMIDLASTYFADVLTGKRKP